MLKNDVAHGLTVSLPNRDRLTMRFNPFKTLGLILSLSKDEAKISCFFSSLLNETHGRHPPPHECPAQQSDGTERVQT